MTSLADTVGNSSQKVNLLQLGDSGAGKTGALASLVDAGLRLRVLDFDGGQLGPVAGYVKDKSKLANVSYVTVNDDYKLTAGRLGIKKAAAFQTAMDALDKGTPFGPDIPPAVEWGLDTVLVIDTLSVAGRAALAMLMAANGRGFQQPHQSDYGTAMDSIENLLHMGCKMLNCHFIVNTHTVLNDAGQMLPEALGAKLLPKVAKPFDNMVYLSVTGGKRSFKTRTHSTLALKSAVPLDETYPIATGLADIFRALTGKKELV